MTGDAAIDLRPAGECRWDAMSLGEVMLRLDPGERRIRTARQFAAWEAPWR
jgi:2-dehydro-3-deoxygluconokinase